MGRLLITLLLLLLFSSCHNNKFDVNTSRIDLKVEIRRFDRELFEINTDTIPEAISFLYNRYGDFLEIYSYHVISIGLPTERTYPGYLKMFLNDGLNREVYVETGKVFPDLKTEEKILTDAFKRYKYYFPEKTIPEIVAFISRFNNACFTVSNFLGVGLDMYMGSSSEYYKKLDLPQYQKSNMYREKIPSDLMYAWASAVFPYHDSVNNVLSHIIHQGKLMYFVEATLPGQTDEVRMGYTKDQMRWLKNNEEMMWVYMIENKLLFSDDPLDTRKLTGPAPFTFFFTNESPGRAAVWTGIQILRKFVYNNPGWSLRQIMEENDYQKILRLSKYDP